MSESIYIYMSNQRFLLNHKVELFIDSLSIDPFNIMRYDLLESHIDDIIEDLKTISFFSEQKLIVIDHFEAMNEKEQFDIKEMVQYFKKPNPDVILVCKLSEMIPDTHPIGAAILNYGYIEKIKDLDKTQYHQFVQAMFEKEGFKISEDATTELLIRTNEDFDLIEREMEKLTLYHFEDKWVDIDAVMMLTTKNLEENVYELTNALLSNHQAKMVEIYNDLMMRNEDPLRILNQIANKLRELMHVKLLLEQGYNQASIATHFNIKSGRAYFLVKDAQAIGLKTLERHLNQLAKLDYEIKSGKKDKKIGLELYLLGV